MSNPTRYPDGKIGVELWCYDSYAASVPCWASNKFLCCEQVLSLLTWVYLQLFYFLTLSWRLNCYMKRWQCSLCYSRKRRKQWWDVVCGVFLVRSEQPVVIHKWLVWSTMSKLRCSPPHPYLYLFWLPSPTTFDHYFNFLNVI